MRRLNKLRRIKREYNKLDAMNLEWSGGHKLIFITGAAAITERDLIESVLRALMTAAEAGGPEN